MHRRLAGEGVRLIGSGWRDLRFSDDSKYLGMFIGTEWWPPGACLYPREEQCKRNFRTPYFILSVSGSVWCGSKFICPASSIGEIRNDLSQFNDAFTFGPENPKVPPIPLPKTINGKTQYQGKSCLSPKQQYISPDGSRGLSYDEYGIVNNFPRFGHSEVMYAGTLWDVPNNKVINTFSFPYIDIYAFSHDLGSVAYMEPMEITVLDIQSGINRGQIPFANCLGKLAFSPDGNILAGYFRNVIYFCNPLTGKVTQTISVPTGFVSNIAFSPDSKFVASTGQTWGNYLDTSQKNYDPFVYIWDISDGSLVSTLEHQGDTEVVKYSPDGKYIATGAGIDNAGPAVALPKDERFILWSWDGKVLLSWKNRNLNGEFQI
jgi:WD40 domain-containing protein